MFGIRDSSRNKTPKKGYPFPISEIANSGPLEKKKKINSKEIFYEEKYMMF